MPRLIDADATRKNIQNLKMSQITRVKTLERILMMEWCRAEMLKIIDNAPTIDAEPVRHGRWGETQVIGYDGIHPVYGKPCSKCGYETELYKPNYCPNCGAKMDGGKDNDCE